MHTHMHTHIHTHNTQIQDTQIQDTQMHNNTLANIYINTEYRTQIQQYAAHRTEQYRIQNTENNAQKQTHKHTYKKIQRTEQNLNAHTQHNLVHIVLIFIIDTYISKNSIT